MSFLRKLFGGESQQSHSDDPHGVYFYVQCDGCGAVVRVRADSQHDFNVEGGYYVWHKTIVDSKCFRRMQTVVTMDKNYQMVNHELQGGRYISREEYEAALKGEGDSR